MSLDEFHADTTWNPPPDTRRWDIRLPWRTPPINANSRVHWRAKARIVADIRAQTHDAARYILEDPLGNVPRLDRVAVALIQYPPDRRIRDRDNLVVPLLKACCDGIVDTGLVPDDRPEFMVKHMPFIAEPDGDPRLVLLLWEVPD